MSRVYLDHNATSPLRPQARAAMLAALDLLGNPSSVHSEGRAAKALLEDARASIARGVGAAPRNLVFTSGATEAANLALSPGLGVDVLLLGAGEHAAVLSGHRFAPERVETAPLTADGTLSLTALDAALARHAGGRVALALQAVNNETGVIQPLLEASARVHAIGGLVICDATQAVGRCDVTFSTFGADLMFFSSHKIGGPPGAGALVFAGDAPHLGALIRGGGQEFGRRAGTENLPAIAGFAAAFRAALATREGETARLGRLRDALEQRVSEIAPDAMFYGRDAPRVANTSAFALPGLSARTLLMALDLEGVAASSGSACSSGKVKESHVLVAMGAKEKEALRLSLGWSSHEDDVKQFGTVLAKVVDHMKSRP